MPDLAAMLMRRSIGRSPPLDGRCDDCRRTPLAGERLHELDSGRALCELCFGALPDESRRAVRSERVHASERRLASCPRPPSPSAARRMARAVRQVTVSTVISAPREQVFDFVCDLAARPAYTDHFMRDYRLARVNPVGLGAAARFQLKAPLRQGVRRAPDQRGRPAAPDRRGDQGRPARPQPLASPSTTSSREGARRHARGADHLQRAGHAVDRVKELGAAGWMRRQTKKALERLRMIFEEPPSGGSSGPRSPATSRRRRPASGRHAGWTPPARRAGRPPRMPRPMLRRLRPHCRSPAPARSASPLGWPACGDEEQGVDEPAREGLALEIGGRRLQRLHHPPAQPEDPAGQRLRDRRRRRPGETLYGVFLQACNNSDEQRDDGQPSSS